MNFKRNLNFLYLEKDLCDNFSVKSVSELLVTFGDLIFYIPYNVSDFW